MATTKTIRTSYFNLGEKLRRLAKTAETSNLMQSPPITIPPAWVTSTAYLKGHVVSNANNWYMSITNGTSGATVPTGTNTVVGISDGTVVWQYLGGPTITANSAQSPTITITTTPSGSLSCGWQWYSKPGTIRTYGATMAQYAGFLGQLTTFNSNTTTGQTSSGSKVAFWTDAPVFAIGTGNAEQFTPTRVSIDGNYHSPTGHFVNGGASPTYMVYDYSAIAARKNRYVTVEMGSARPEWFGVLTTPSDTIWPPSTQDDVRAVFISDSIASGSSTYGPFIPGNYLTNRVATLLGWNDPWTFSTGGTGYVANNSSASHTYGNRITQGLALTPDVWVFFGSTNDSTGIQAAVTAALTAIRNGGSTAPIIVFGIWPLSGAATKETDVAAGVAGYSDPVNQTYFIPVSNDTNMPWLTGTWNNSSLTTSNNAAFYVCNDSIHPPDVGTAYLANRMAQAIKNLVLPNL